VNGFVRYAFLERRGTNYVALPTGRFDVKAKPSLRLLDDLDPILSRVDHFLRQFPNVPATFERARQVIDDAIFQCVVSPSALRFTKIVKALGQLEFLVALRDRSKTPKLNSPLSGLSMDWISACDDGSTEIRIAAALASIHATEKVGGIRANMAGVSPSAPWNWADGKAQQSWFGNTLVERLGGVLAQRIMDFERLGCSRVPVEGSLPIMVKDVVPFLMGETDDRAIEEYLWGFTLVSWRSDGVGELLARWKSPVAEGVVPRAWALMKLLFSPGEIRDVSVAPEPSVISMLRAGRADDAVASTRNRLVASGLRPLPVSDGNWIDSYRQLAALLVPVRDRFRLESMVLQKEITKQENS
jgi:CRISPR-associated protein Csx17